MKTAKFCGSVKSLPFQKIEEFGKHKKLDGTIIETLWEKTIKIMKMVGINDCINAAIQ